MNTLLEPIQSRVLDEGNKLHRMRTEGTLNSIVKPNTGHQSTVWSLLSPEAANCRVALLCDVDNQRTRKRTVHDIQTIDTLTSRSRDTINTNLTWFDRVYRLNVPKWFIVIDYKYQNTSFNFERQTFLRHLVCGSEVVALSLPLSCIFKDATLGFWLFWGFFSFSFSILLTLKILQQAAQCRSDTCHRAFTVLWRSAASKSDSAASWNNPNFCFLGLM